VLRGGQHSCAFRMPHVRTPGRRLSVVNKDFLDILSACKKISRKLPKAATRLICIQEAPGSNLGRDIDLVAVSSGLRQYLQANARIGC
jgi:hypothetical protein